VRGAGRETRDRAARLDGPSQCRANRRGAAGRRATSRHARSTTIGGGAVRGGRAPAPPGGPGRLGAGEAGAGPRVRRPVATAAPDGSGWARELKVFAREVENATHGEVSVRFYFGGLAGDEIVVGERIQRGQLDGATSGHMLCQKTAPSLRSLRIPGVVRTRE